MSTFGTSQEQASRGESLREDTLLQQLDKIATMVDEIAVEAGLVGLEETIVLAGSRSRLPQARTQALAIGTEMAQRARVLENEVTRLLSSMRPS